MKRRRSEQATERLLAGSSWLYQGQLRAIADILGHSPDMLMKTYAHAMPASMSTVVQGIADRSR